MPRNPNSKRPKRFLTHSTQTKKPVEKLTYAGRTRSIAEWADQMDLSYDCLRYRIRAGWSIERALTEDPR